MTAKGATVTEAVPTESKSSKGTPAEANNTAMQIPDGENGCVMAQRPLPIREEKTEGDDIQVDVQFDCQISSAVEWALKGVEGNNLTTTNATESETSAETRKRATTAAKNPPQRSQEVKPVESTGFSPEKKVRKTSTSPFGKKNGCVELDIKKKENKETSSGRERVCFRV